MKNRNLRSVFIIFLVSSFLVGCGTKEKETSQTEVIETELPSLQAALDEKKNQFEQRASAEVIKTFNEGVQAVATSGAMESALNVGDTAPDFTLPNATGEEVKLSGLLQDGPVILIWYRGGW